LVESVAGAFVAGIVSRVTVGRGFS